MGSEFFDLDDFILYTGIAYADLVGQEYIVMYNQMRQDGNMDIVEFSHDWLKTEVVKKQSGAEGYFIELSQPVMSFPFDKRDVGVQNIFPVASKFKGEFIRSSISEYWKDQYLPLTQHIYWALLKDKIFLSSNLVEPPAEMRVIYVPSAGGDLDIPASRQQSVIKNTIQLMREAAKGFVVNETNDGNTNEIIETEADLNLIKK